MNLNINTSAIRSGLGLTVLALLAFAALGQEADEAQAPSRPAPDTGQTADDGASARTPTDDVFIPTEEIPADEEVTFPVDI